MNFLLSSKSRCYFPIALLLIVAFVAYAYLRSKLTVKAGFYDNVQSIQGIGPVQNYEVQGTDSGTHWIWVPFSEKQLNEFHASNSNLQPLSDDVLNRESQLAACQLFFERVMKKPKDFSAAYILGGIYKPVYVLETPPPRTGIYIVDVR